MPETTTVFLVNPSANRTKAFKRLGWLRSTLAQTWPGSRIILSKKPGDIARIGREEAEKGHTVIACGGDGTINELMNGVAGLDAVVGVLPMGSGNDFAKSVGISLTKEEALEDLRSAVASPIDLIRYESNSGNGICDNTIGIGFDGWANFHAHQNTVFKGTLQYLYATVKTAFTFKPVHMKVMVDEVELAGRFYMVTICNGTTEGGNFKVAPMADNTDGWMDVILLGPCSILGLFFRLPFFVFGAHMRFGNIHHHRCKTVRVDVAQPVGVHVDGEEIGQNDVTWLEANIWPGAIRALRGARN